MPGPHDPFADAGLYDWTYRRRRDDVRFYRTLADERGGPVLDLGCGTGRLLVPLLRDGHVVAGIDGAPAMLARAQARIARLAAPARHRALLVRGDFRALPFVRRFAFAVAAFHGFQHLYSDEDLVAGFRSAAATLLPGGWFAFDAFAPSARFLARAVPGARRRRWGRTRFRHPVTGRPTVYTESYRLQGKLLASTFHYQSLDARGRPEGRERRAVLRHRLLAPGEVRALLARAGLTLIATWGGFDGRPLPDPSGAREGVSQNVAVDVPDDDETEQQIFLARRSPR
jgi:SAM-dependent methyltransferase